MTCSDIALVKVGSMYSHLPCLNKVLVLKTFEPFLPLKVNMFSQIIQIRLTDILF